MRKLIFILFLGLLAFVGSTRWQHLSEEPLIMTDGQGYYAYLPAVFIYQDLQFLFIETVNQKYYPPDKRAKFILETPSGNVNKYFAGTAVLQAPFFLAGCALAGVTRQPIDGYSWPFQMMVGLAALVFLVAGFYFLYRFLNGLGFTSKAACVSALLVVFGTNLLYYSIYEPSMSHVYSFFTISAFLFFVLEAHKKQQTAPLFGAAIMLGFTVLIRPTNGVVLLSVPIVTAGLGGFIKLVKRLIGNYKALLGCGFLLIAIVGLQPLVYLIQTDQPMVWSYNEEGFNFLNPELYNVLFSYRKGLFVYCPVLLVAVVGLMVGFVKNRIRFTWLLLFLSLATWIIASWWMWYYGGSYGHRAFIEYYPFFAIGLAALFTHGMGSIRGKWLMVFSLFFVPVQLVQTYQYNKHIITFDNMNKTKFWNLFMRTGDDLAWYYSGYPGQDSYQGLDSVLVKNNFESELGWGNEHLVIDNPSESGKVAQMTKDQGYGPTLRIAVSEIGIDLNNVRISGMTNSDWRNSDIAFVCSLEDSTGAGYYWQRKPLRPQFRGAGNWVLTSALFRCGTPRNPTDKFVIYPMKTDRSQVLFDDLEISFIKAK